ncbi:cell division inhibitor SepF [Spiroplasma chinense]|uniref:Cell division inhibitor SepF n=1 Tax=Spiroplasma chinense TaxID=216932 RepID=A0A5B9Y7M8_9MOLU|nr:cell division protein SepF [Spiroplasma chinense]QEH62102.1 cell division inhibitor SepF [Spiroplasma chinense]
MGLFNKKEDKDQKEIASYQENTKDYNNLAFDIEFNEEHVTHFKPLSYDEIKPIVDCLLKFKNVTVNLNEISKEDKLRLIDFLTGAMYALEGNYKKIDKGIYYFWIG